MTNPGRSGARACLAGALMPLIVGSLMSCEPPLLEEPPPAILGRWTTTDPRYADRAFEITKETVYIHQGGNNFAAYAVKGFQITVANDDDPVHSVVYVDDAAEEYEFRFYVSSEDGGVIRFTNQREMVWHRDPDAPVPWDAVRRGR